MPADPVAAGRKGGTSKSPAKLAACRKNGFQKVNAEPSAPAPGEKPPVQPVLIVTQKASE